MQEDTIEVSRVHCHDDMKGLREEINSVQDKLTAEMASIKNEIVSDIMTFWNENVYGGRGTNSTVVDTAHLPKIRRDNDEQQLDLAQDVNDAERMMTDVKMALELDQI